MVRSTWLIVFLFLAVFSGCQKTHTQKAQSSYNVLQSLPEKDVKVLDSFFQLLCREYDFAYTLFGKKPMSMVYYSSNLTSWSVYHPIEFLTLEKGWELWEDYSIFFTSDEFVLKKCKDKNTSAVFLINKRQALKTISEHLIKFEGILNQKIKPHEFLKQLCNSEQDIMKLLNDNSELLGILLGYGKVNAMLFERKANICKHLNAKMTPPFTSQRDIEKLHPSGQNFVELYRGKESKFDLAILSPLTKHDSLADEMNDIISHEEIFELYGSDFFLDRFISPVFMMRKEDPETQELQASYFATKLKLRQLYQQESFLEITLNQWMCPQ